MMELPILSFNVNDLIDAQAVVQAACECQAPVMLNLSKNAIDFAGLDYLVSVWKVAKRSSQVPIYIQLDHARDLDLVRECIALGVQLVMADGSDLPLEENIRFTRAVVQECHAFGVLVEGEIGRVEKSLDDSRCTEIDEAITLERETGVDFLAVSVGNIHGFSRPKPRLDTHLVADLRSAVRIPLVLHGADFVPRESLAEAVCAGVRKINIGPEIRVPYSRALSQAQVEADSEPDHRRILSRARAAVYEVVADYLSWLKHLAMERNLG